MMHENRHLIAFPVFVHTYSTFCLILLRYTIYLYDLDVDDWVGTYLRLLGERIWKVTMHDG